jgi:hypothetical protein
MYETDEEINNERISKSKVNVPNNHLTVGYITSTDEDIKIIPKTQKPKIIKQTSLLDYNSDSLVSENKIEEFISHIRHNSILQKFIFDKDYAKIEKLLECKKY